MVLIIVNLYVFFDHNLVTMGMDFGENRWELLLQASQTFLNPSRRSKILEKPTSMKPNSLEHLERQQRRKTIVQKNILRTSWTFLGNS